MDTSVPLPDPQDPPTRFDAPPPGRDVGDDLSAQQLSSAAFHAVAQRAEQHLERLLAALPWAVAVIHGEHVLVANPVARARLPGPDAGTFTLADAARMAATAPVIVPDRDGKALRVATRPIRWDNHDCRLLIAEPHPPEPLDAAPMPPVVAPPAPLAPDAPARALEAPPSLPAPVAPRTDSARERWWTLVDLAAGRVAGAVIDPGADADEAEFQRCLVRGIGALAEWGADRAALETPVTMVKVPVGVAFDAALVAFVDAVMRRAPAHASRLWLRVPRAALADTAAPHLAALRRSGPRVLVEAVTPDDVPATMAAFPIDGMAVPPEALTAGDWPLVHSALSIARHHGLATLAADVADATTHERLRAVGCRWAEGVAYGDTPLTRAAVRDHYGATTRPRPAT